MAQGGCSAVVLTVPRDNVRNLSLLSQLISVSQTTEYHRFDQTTTSGNNRPSAAGRAFSAPVVLTAALNLFSANHSSQDPSNVNLSPEAMQNAYLGLPARFPVELDLLPCRLLTQP